MKRFAVKLAVLAILIVSISPVFTKPAMAANRNEFVGGWYIPISVTEASSRSTP